jgi:hypothetical protein
MIISNGYSYVQMLILYFLESMMPSITIYNLDLVTGFQGEKTGHITTGIENVQTYNFFVLTNTNQHKTENLN